MLGQCVPLVQIRQARLSQPFLRSERAQHSYRPRAAELRRRGRGG